MSEYKNLKKFKGPIEEVVFKQCPGRSYCKVDKCFRKGEGCISSGGDCCLNDSMLKDLLNDLGCPQDSSNTYKIDKPECQTVQQYCDMIEPELLKNSAIKSLCCDIDLQSGVRVRGICGCEGEPCSATSSNKSVTRGVNAFESSRRIRKDENIFLVIGIILLVIWLIKRKK